MNAARRALVLSLALAGCVHAAPPAIHAAPGYDFGAARAAILGEHESADDFVRLYEKETEHEAPAADTYPLALANQTLGIVRDDPLPILRARELYAATRDTAADLRRREAADLGVRYCDSLLSGEYAHTDPAASPPSPVAFERDPPPAAGFRRIVLGRSAIHVDKGTLIKTQVDRVTRDWLLAGNLTGDPCVFAAETHITWHEGRKLAQIVELTGARVVPVWGTRAVKIGDAWYAPDATGAPRFEISPDKVQNYPGTIVVDDHHALVNDTHGISAIAWDSLDADLVVGCGDHPGKMQAAAYLALRGVNVYVATDRFLGELMGARTKGTIIGSAPVKRSAGGAVIGDQPVAIDPDETIVVSTAAGTYPLRYYDTPERYFKALAEFARRPLHLVTVEVKEYGRATNVVDEARRLGAKVIGTRVKSRLEHDSVHAWLAEDPSRRAILFHTAVYPDGDALYAEFPAQTSFGDIHPAFE